MRSNFRCDNRSGLFERVFMEVLFAASSAALPTDAGRFTERELHAPNEDSLLHPALVGQVQLPSDATACCLCRAGER